MNTKEILESLKDMDDVFRLLLAIEGKFEMIMSAVTRADVNDQYRQMWEADDKEAKDLTDEQWEQFQQTWFWRDGYSEVMWDDVPTAIRWELREMGITPGDAVIE